MAGRCAEEIRLHFARLCADDQPRSSAADATEQPGGVTAGDVAGAALCATYKRTGTLWDSRYKSSLVHADDYLLLCQRYIELNPVRAGMVDDPAQYRWSSYRANGLGQPDDLLTPHAVYLGRR